MNKLRALRSNAGLTLAELAEKSGVAVATITRIERGEKAYALTLGKLARALGVDISELEELEAVSPKDDLPPGLNRREANEIEGVSAPSTLS